jgi:peptidoglycan hydrolase CwlO-like protein
MIFCVYKQKQKELKRQKQEKENCFANLKEQEDSHWCYLPKLR